MKTVDKEKLWDDYRKNPTPALREQLIIEYAQLVKLVAGRLSMYLGHNVEYEDLVSYGIFNEESICFAISVFLSPTHPIAVVLAISNIFAPPAILATSLLGFAPALTI